MSTLRLALRGGRSAIGDGADNDSPSHCAVLCSDVDSIINAASEDVDCMFPEDFKYTEFPIEDLHDGQPCSATDLPARLSSPSSLLPSPPLPFSAR